MPGGRPTFRYDYWINPPLSESWTLIHCQYKILEFICMSLGSYPFCKVACGRTMGIGSFRLGPICSAWLICAMLSQLTGPSRTYFWTLSICQLVNLQSCLWHTTLGALRQWHSACSDSEALPSFRLRPLRFAGAARDESVQTEACVLYE